MLAGGCASPPDQPQILTGKVVLSTFSEAPTGLRALHRGRSVTEVPLAADGSFRISLPARASYHLELVAPKARPVVVFPRRSGAIESGLYVGAPGRPYALGTLRRVAQPKQETIRAPLTSVACNTDGGVMCDNENQDDDHQGVTEADGGGNRNGNRPDGGDEMGGDHQMGGRDQMGGGQDQTDRDEADGANNQCGVNESNGNDNQMGASEAAAENVEADETVMGDHVIPDTLGCSGNTGGTGGAAGARGGVEGTGGSKPSGD
jgi:hypothetical protein